VSKIHAAARRDRCSIIENKCWPGNLKDRCSGTLIALRRVSVREQPLFLPASRSGHGAMLAHVDESQQSVITEANTSRK